MPPDEIAVDVYVVGTDVIWYDSEEEQHTQILEEVLDG